MLFKKIPVCLLVIGVGCVISACGNDRREWFKDLSEEQKVIAFAKVKQEIVYGMICSEFRKESGEYKIDRRKKEFSPDHEYFYDYPRQLRVLQSPPFYEYSRAYVHQVLRARGILELSPDFDTWLAPSLLQLPCQGDISEWQALKQEWESLKNTLPNSFYKQETIWDDIGYYFDILTDYISAAFNSVIKFLIVGLITAYSILLHHAAIVKRNPEGLWLLLATPLSALYWQKHLGLIVSTPLAFWLKVLVTCLILIPLYALLAVTIGKLLARPAPTREELDDAIVSGNLSEVKYILRRDRSLVSKFDKGGLTPLHTLARKGVNVSSNDASIARALIDHGADVNERTKSELGWAPIHFIASQGDDTRPEHVTIAKVLLSNGADPDIKSTTGWTPLHMIAINGSEESLTVLDELFSHHANPHATGDDGVTTWEMLWQHGNEVYDAIYAYQQRNFNS